MSKERIEEALRYATDTKACAIGDGVLEQTAALFGRWFPGAARAVIVADPRTWAAAGEAVAAQLKSAGAAVEHYILEPGGRTFHADYHYAAEVREALRARRATDGDLVPVAVGSGVVNDLTKLASGELGVPYMVCATAASVDGYSSFGAAIRSPEGAKKTSACPAPRVIV
ncbi:MAG: iron-containing alcohol dehydrogenase, partial [Kiritimatiellia bacterium]